MILDALRRRRHQLRLPAFGGDVRPPVIGPAGIKAQLVRLAFARTMLTTIIIVLAVAILALAIRTPSVMATELFVADGTAFGCHLTTHLGE